MAGSFTLDISRFIARAGRNRDLVVRKIVLDVGTAIVMRTPVGDPDTWVSRSAPPGYVGGRARGSWQYGFSAPKAGEGPIDGSGQGPINRIQAGVSANPAAGVHYLTSTVPYMRRLEYESWSRQAPEGMVRLTILEYQRFVDEAARSANP